MQTGLCRSLLFPLMGPADREVVGAEGVVDDGAAVQAAILTGLENNHLCLFADFNSQATSLKQCLTCCSSTLPHSPLESKLLAE